MPPSHRSVLYGYSCILDDKVNLFNPHFLRSADIPRFCTNWARNNALDRTTFLKNGASRGYFCGRGGWEGHWCKYRQFAAISISCTKFWSGGNCTHHPRSRTDDIPEEAVCALPDNWGRLLGDKVVDISIIHPWSKTTEEINQCCKSAFLSFFKGSSGR